jgi:hypothetical protein
MNELPAITTMETTNFYHKHNYCSIYQKNQQTIKATNVLTYATIKTLDAEFSKQARNPHSFSPMTTVRNYTFPSIVKYLLLQLIKCLQMFNYPLCIERTESECRHTLITADNIPDQRSNVNTYKRKPNELVPYHYSNIAHSLLKAFICVE